MLEDEAVAQVRAEQALGRARVLLALGGEEREAMLAVEAEHLAQRDRPQVPRVPELGQPAGELPRLLLGEGAVAVP